MTSWLKPAPGVAWVDEGGDRIVAVDVNAEEPRPALLEGTAAEGWRRIADGVELESFIRDLAGHYSDAPEERHTEVRTFVDQLVASGLACLSSRRA